MYIDEDYLRFYYPEMYEEETEDTALDCPYRQLDSFQTSAQDRQGGPPSAPPNFIPPQPKSQQFGATPLAIDAGAIRPCRNRFVYIWPRRGDGFWAWLTFVGPKSVAGFRFYRNRWRYFGMDLREISSFNCF